MNCFSANNVCIYFFHWLMVFSQVMQTMVLKFVSVPSVAKGKKAKTWRKKNLFTGLGWSIWEKNSALGFEYNFLSLIDPPAKQITNISWPFFQHWVSCSLVQYTMTVHIVKIIVHPTIYSHNYLNDLIICYFCKQLRGFLIV